MIPHNSKKETEGWKQKDGNCSMVMGRRDEIIVIMIIMVIIIIRAYRKITRRGRPLSSPNFL